MLLGQQVKLCLQGLGGLLEGALQLRVGEFTLELEGLLLYALDVIEFPEVLLLLLCDLLLGEGDPVLDLGLV